MVQKAVVYETRSQKIVRQDKDLRDLYALNRSRITVQQTVISPGGATPSGGGGQGGSGNFLETEGDTMIGPIAFNQVLVLINSAGRIKIGEQDRSNAFTPLDYSTYVAVTAAGDPDDLNWIDGAAYNGQYLILQGTVSQLINVINAIFPSISNITGTGTVTVITSAAHGLATGQEVNIKNTTNFNVDSVVITVTGGTTFTYSDAGNAVAETSGDVQDGNIVSNDATDVVLDGNVGNFTRPIVELIFDQIAPLGGAWRVMTRPDGATGEVFTWTADHDAADFDLLQVDNITSGANNSHEWDISRDALAGIVDIGSLRFRSFDAGSVLVDYVTLVGRVESQSAANEEGSLKIQLTSNGVHNVNYMRFNDAGNNLIDVSTDMSFGANSINGLGGLFNDGVGTNDIGTIGSPWSNMFVTTIKEFASSITFASTGISIVATATGDDLTFSSDDPMLFVTADSVGANWLVNGSTRMTIQDNALVLTVPLSIGGNDVDFATGGTVDFADTTTSATAGVNGDVPAQVVGYATVRINGTLRKVPFYAA